jgi:hypothetical protein
MGCAAANAHAPASKKFLRRFFQKAATCKPGILQKFRRRY